LDDGPHHLKGLAEGHPPLDQVVREVRGVQETVRACRGHAFPVEGKVAVHGPIMNRHEVSVS
jgi:hypothetical protein